MNIIKTATGKEIPCNYCVVYEPARQVTIRLRDMSLAKAAAIFDNPAETVQLWHNDQYLAHYTKLLGIVNEGPTIRVVLERM